MGTIEYLTAHRTIVTSKRVGRPPKEPRPKGSFDLIAQNNQFTLVDACVPLALAKTFKALFDAYEG